MQFEVCEGDKCYFTLQTLMILCPSYLLFMVLNGGLSVPGGLFMPGIMVNVTATSGHNFECIWQELASKVDRIWPIAYYPQALKVE